MVYGPHLISLKINDLYDSEMMELRDLLSFSILGCFYFFPTKESKIQKELIAEKQAYHRAGAIQRNGLGIALNHGISFELRKCGFLE